MIMKKIVLLLVVLLTGIVSNNLAAQESKYKALYLFNFTKYINWENEEITIGVIGNSPVLIELQSLVKQNPKINLVKIAGDEKVSECDMIFLPSAQGRNFNLINSKSKRNVIIVSEDEDFISKGAEMAFYVENDKLKFMVSRSALDDSGIKMSSTFLSNARMVD